MLVLLGLLKDVNKQPVTTLFDAKLLREVISEKSCEDRIGIADHCGFQVETLCYRIPWATEQGGVSPSSQALDHLLMTEVLVNEPHQLLEYPQID